MNDERRPIGYWLKHLDHLIETTFEQILMEQNLSRRHWQMLNVLGHEPLGESGLQRTLHPFWNDPTMGLAELCEDLLRRGWIAQEEHGVYHLTPAGAKVREALAERVQILRARQMDGLTKEDYERTVKVLSCMAANLEGRPDGSAAGASEQ